METETQVMRYNHKSNKKSMNESTPNNSGRNNLIQLFQKNPLHEEYLLNALRDKFRRDTQQFFDEKLIQDFRNHKKMHLEKVEKSQLILNHSETLLHNMKSHCDKFDKDSYIFLKKTRNQIMKLQQDSRSMSNEAIKEREKVRALFKSFNK